MAPGIVSAPYLKEQRLMDRKQPGNPITNWYETKDGRWIYLVLLQGDRFWGEVCTIIGREDLIDDPRFKDGAVRFENRAACVKELDGTFATRTLAEWKEKLQALSGVWAPAITFKEVHDHPQVEPNGFLPKVMGHDGVEFRLVSPAMHFDGQPTAPAGPAPECGQDTEAILMDAGLDWDEITSLRERGGLG
jgi:formyl-CoA transferase